MKKYCEGKVWKASSIHKNKFSLSLLRLAKLIGEIDHELVTL